MAKILVVEDDEALARTILGWLAADKHTVDVVHTGTDGLDRLRFYNYDAVVLDWNLPGVSGVEICREFRTGGGNTPIMMLTAKGKIEEKEHGFEVGADDYLTKPFDFREFIARLKALLRRPAVIAGTNNILQYGDVILNPVTHLVTKAGVPVKLLPKEYALLEFLLKHPNQVLSAEAILDRVWPSSSDMSPESVRVYVARLRKKLDDQGESSSLIRTVHGFGYKFGSE